MRRSRPSPSGLPTLPTLLISLLVVSESPLSAATDQCSVVTRDSNYGGSCTFEDGWCGWTNKYDQLQWTQQGIGSKGYLSINMDGVRSGSNATLLSPVLCATGSGLRSFRFRYFLDLPDRCRLTVHVLTAGTGKAQQVWRSTRGNLRQFQSVRPLGLSCPRQPFQILFVGEKLSNRSCGRLYNEIDIKDIVYENAESSFPSLTGECLPLPSTTTSTTTTATTTTVTLSTTAAPKTTTAATSTRTTNTTAASTVSSSSDVSNGTDTGAEADDGLSDGIIAGIVIVVIIIIVVIVVVIVCLFMRRQKKWAWKAKSSLPTGVIIQRSETHRTHYMLGAQPSGTALSEHQRQPNYPTIVIPESSSAPPPPSPPVYTNTTPETPAPGSTHPRHHPHPAALLAKEGKRLHAPSSTEAVEAGGDGWDTTCGADSVEGPNPAVEYANCRGDAQLGESDGRYNVPGENVRRLYLPQNNSSSARDSTRGDNYDHLNAGVFAHTGWERTEQGQSAAVTAGNPPPSQPLAGPLTAKRARVGPEGTSRHDHADRGADECEYANDSSTCSSEGGDGASAALPWGVLEEGADLTYCNWPQTPHGGKHATRGQYSLAQHGRHDRPEDSGGGPLRQSVSQTPSGLHGHCQQSSTHNLGHTAAQPQSKNNCEIIYSLAKKTELLNGDTAHKCDVTHGVVSRKWAPGQRKKRTGGIPRQEDGSGHYVNGQKADNELERPNQGDPYDESDWNDCCDGEAEYYNTVPDERDCGRRAECCNTHPSAPEGWAGCDDLQLSLIQQGKSADRDLYCNVNGSNASPC
ncbi:hypothetical protein ACOMHN_001332 [Nucella lapillus]